MPRGIFTPYEQQPRNAVSVYSPIRPLRPSGGFANAGTANQILGGGQSQPQQTQTSQTPRLRIPGVRGSLPGLQYQAPQQGAPLPVPGGSSYLDRLEASMGSPEPQPVNSGGFLGSVVNSLPGRAIFGALNVLDYPRRAVISTVQEAADAFNGGDASFGDWVHQVNDPSFGFGDVVGSTGNIWADRLIGFAGDVLLDPLTYVAGSSVITGTGRTARVGGAIRAIEHGVDPAIAGRLGKFGYAAVDRTERQLLREAANDTILDPGWYWKLPFAPERTRLRIPGTGGLDTAVGGFFGRRRAQLAATPIGTAFRNMNTPERLEAAMTKIVTGRGDMPLAYATEFVRFRNAADRAGPVATARLNALSQELFAREGREGMNEAMRQAQRDGTGAFAEWTQEALNILEEYGGRLPAGPRARYAPLIPTEGGAEWLRSGKQGDFAFGFKNEFYKDIDLDEVPVHLMTRQMFVPGTTRTINGKVFDVGDASINHLNAEFARLVPEADFKLFDDDASSVMARYAKSIEDGIGTIAGLKALQNSKAGLVRSADDDSVLKVVEDFAKTKLLNEKEVERAQMLARAASDSLKKLREDNFKGISGIQGVMGQVLRGTIDSLQEVEPRLKARLQGLLQEEQALARQRGGRSMNGAFGRTSFEGMPDTPVKGRLETEFDRLYTDLQRKLEKAQNRLAKVRERAAVEMPEWERIKREAMERGEIARIPRHLVALREWQATYEEAGRLAMDREAIQVMRARVIAHDTRRAIIDARIGDENFLFAAANRGADEYAPIRDVREKRYTMPGNTDPDTGLRTPDTLWRLRSEDDRAVLLNEEGQVNRARALAEARRREVLGLGNDSTNPEVLEISARIGEQLKAVTEHEMIVAATARRDGPAIARALQAFEMQRRVEAKYEGMLHLTLGRPEQAARQAKIEDYLYDLRSPTGALSESRNAYQDAQSALEQSKKRLSLENKVLQALREEQLSAALGDTGDALVDTARAYGPPAPIETRLPLNPTQERDAKRTLDRAQAALDRWEASPQGTQLRAAQTERDEIRARLRTINRDIETQTTGTTTVWMVDDRGNLRPKPGTNAARHETVLRLVAERDQLEIQLDALLQATPTGTTMAAATGQERNVKSLQRRIRERNRKLAKLSFNDQLYRDYVVLRDTRSAELRARQDALAVARTSGDKTAIGNAERAVARGEQALLDADANADLAISYARRQTSLSSLLDERRQLQARERQLNRVTGRDYPQLNKLQSNIEAARAPLDSQNKARLIHADEQGEWEQLQLGYAYTRQQRQVDTAKQAWDEAQARWQQISDEGMPSGAARLNAAQRDVKTAYNAYKAAKSQLDQMAPGLKKPLSTPPAITREAQMRASLHAVEEQEREAVERIRASLQATIGSPAAKVNWELVPKITPAKYPFAIDERMLLQRAYSKIASLRAGVTAEGHDLSIESARRTVREVEDLLYPVSPRQAAAAADELAEIERALGLIDASRMPFPFPEKGTKLYNILIKDPSSAETRGGAMDLISRAKASLDSSVLVAGAKSGEGYEDVLVQAGALIPGDFRHVREMGDELINQLKIYAKSPHPMTTSRINQLTADLGRWADFMWTYKRVIDAQQAPDDRLAAFILSRSLYKEQRVLDSRIKEYRGLIQDDVERWAAMEHNRKIIARQLTIDDAEDTLDAMRTAKLEGGAFDQREYKRVYERQRKAAREMEELQKTGSPILGLLDEDLDAMYAIVSGAIEDMDNATMKLRDARAVVADLDRPFRKREALEAQIPLVHGRITEMRGNVQDLKERIADAVSRGQGTVHWSPWSTNVNPIDWTIEEAERMIPAAPPHMRPELQRKLRLAKDRRARARNINRRQAFTSEPRVQLSYARVDPYRSNQIEMTIEEAQQRIAINSKAIGDMADLEKLWTLQLSVLDGSAAQRQKKLKRLLLDETNPPDPQRLQDDIDFLMARAERESRKLLPHEQDSFDFLNERLANITRAEGSGQPNAYGGYGMTPEDFERVTQEDELLTSVIARYNELHGGNEDYIASVIDGGSAMLQQVLRGERDPTTQEIQTIIDLLGGEKGEYAATWVRTLNNALHGVQRVAGGAPRAATVNMEQLQGVFQEMAFVLGDSSLGERMAQRAAGLITESGEMDAGVFQAMRDELYMSLVSTANRERTERIRDFSDTLKNLGFEFFIEDRNAIPMTGVPPGMSRANLTLNEKMHRVGYQQSKERFTPAKLRLFILQRFEQMGYDVKKSLEGQMDDLLMRSQRLDTMRRGLGGQVNIRHMRDPEGFWLSMARSRELNAAEDAGNIASDADLFRRLSVPDDVSTTYNQRLAALQLNLRTAINSNDETEINQAMELLSDFQAAHGLPTEYGPEGLPPPQALPPPPAAATAQTAPVTPQMDPAIEQKRLDLANQRDTAQADLNKVQIQIQSLATERATGAPAAGDPRSELETLRQQIEGQLPENRYSQAHLELMKVQLMDLVNKGGANRTPQETELMRQLRSQFNDVSENLMWPVEPTESVVRAKELGAQYEAMIEGGEAVVDNSGELAALRQRAQEYEEALRAATTELESLPARPAVLPPPGEATPPPGDVIPPGEPPSTVTQTDEALADEGFAAPEAAPDEIPTTVHHPEIPDEQLSPDDVRYEHRMLVREFEHLQRTYGSFENAPAQIQEQMGQMSARIRRLAELQNVRAREALRGTDLYEGVTDVVDWDRYQELTTQPAREIVYDWRNVLTHGTPSVQVSRTMMKGAMADAVQLVSGGRPGISGGRLLANSLPSQRAALEAAKGPMEALRSRLIAVGEEAASLSAADKAAMESAGASIAAREAAIDTTRNRLTAEAAAPSPEYTQAVAGQQAARAEITAETTAAQHQLAALQMNKLRAEQQYTQTLTDLDMQLGAVREKVTLVRNEHAAIERMRDDFNRAIDTVPNKDNMRPLIQDLRDLNEWRRGRPGLDPAARQVTVTTKAGKVVTGDEPTIDYVEALLQEAAKATGVLDQIALLNDNMAAHRLKEWESGARSVAPVVQRVITDAWKVMAPDLLTGPDRVVMARDLARAIEHITKAAAQPQTWKLIDKYTAFFKTYATARPGFHVRNAVSAVFMNLVDNVRLRHMGAAPGLWRSFMSDSRGSWERMGTQVLNAKTGATMRDAFAVVFGSGAGGQWVEYGVGTATAASSRAYQRLMNNSLTRWNRRAGSFVEGTARLAMAIDSLEKGMLPSAALDRVTKFHFNYNAVSRLDRTVKRYIPFWTFMSRNFPLQIEQMWVRPQMYLKYQSFVRNFSEAANPATPQYWLAQGAFTMDPTAEGARGEDAAPWYLAPDLPHLRVAEPFEALAQGNWGKAALSDINPLFLAPAEAFGFNKKIYTGAPVEENYRQPQGAMRALTPLFALLGGTKRGGTTGELLVDDRYAHVARSLLPPLEFAERLTDTSGVRAGRQDETLLRALGAPVYQLTPEIRRSARTSAYYQRANELETQAELAGS